MNTNLFFASTTNSTLGLVTLDILANENLKLPSEVTKYPVEDGSEEISDHITQSNEELSITGRVSSSAVLSFSFGPGLTRLVDAVDQMRSMHKDRKAIKVVTGLGTYEDMAFTNLSITRSNGADGGYWLDINADLRKLKKVSVKETDLPEDKASTTDGANNKTGTTEKKASTSTTSTDTPKDISGLKSLQNYGNTKSSGSIPVGSYASPSTPR